MASTPAIRERYESKHEDARRTKSKAWRRANPDKVRERNLKAKYGITPTELDRILADQNGCCAICERKDPGPKGWCVDHDHSTGLVRGILCTKCNQSLGLNGDCIDKVKDTFTRQSNYLNRASNEHAKLQSANDCPSVTESRLRSLPGSSTNLIKD